VVACILYPEQASELDKDDLFFHSTMSNPEIQQTPNQQTALHLATKVHSQGVEARKVIMALLTLFPEAAAFRNPRDDCYPLHYLCKNESKVQWIQDGFRDVYEANKEAIYQGNYSNQLPLHLAASVARYRPSPVIATITKPAQHTQDAQNPLQQHSNMDAVGSIIQNLIEAYPESSRQLDHLGMHPFHYIAKNSELWTLDVEVLYMSYPQAIHTPTAANQNIPLHLAAGNMDARGDFIHALVKLYPSGCAITNDEGKLPLHLACEVGKNWDEGVQYIYNAYNEALFTRAGKSGKLPIHFAAESKSCPKGLLAHLVEWNMKSTIVKDSRGQTPLHLAIQSGKFWDDGLDILIHAGPDSMDIADNHGIVPFVLAALKHCYHTCRVDDDDDSIRSVETVFELLQRAPFILSHYI
jgi:ankyrin repeat protein